MPDSNLILTKLLVPQSSAKTFSRKRLFDLLERGLEKRLILVCAPAGYGKTTLVASWIGAHEHPVGWISLDARDNTLHGFLSYLWEATMSFNPEQAKIMVAGLSSEKRISSENNLTSLVNAVSEYGEQVTLVLDDYHTIENQEIHGFIKQMIQDAPPNLNLVITTRSDPPIQLGRFRGKSELLELRSRDLAFTEDEFRQFISANTHLELTNQQLDLLYTQTEGWITGASLALLSMPSNTDMAAFLEHFGGTDRNIMDYLIEEVLDQLDDEIHSFLLKTSILDRLSRELCDYLLQVSSSGRILEVLEKQNLFITPLDTHRTWYRFHPLFAQILKHRLASRGVDDIAPLHTRASEWFRDQGELSEAIYHAAASADESMIMDLIKANSGRMLQTARLVELSDWFSLLREETIKTDPVLCMNMSWTLLLMGELTRAREYAELASECATTGLDHENVRANLATIKAYLALFSGQIGESITAAQSALELFKNDEHNGISVAAFTLGNALTIAGRSSEALSAYEQAVYSAQQSNNIHIELPAQHAAASQKRLMGQLQAAEREYHDIFSRYSGTSLSPLPLATSYVGLGEVFTDRLEISPALKSIQQGLEIAERWGNSDAKIHGYLSMAILHLAQKKISLASPYLEQVDALLKLRDNRYHKIAHVHATRVQYLLAHSNIQKARQYLDQHELALDSQVQHHRILEYLTEVKVLLAEGEIHEALINLDRVFAGYESTANLRYLLDIILIRAVALSKLSQEDKAQQAFSQALDLAVQEMILRPFVELGQHLSDLISITDKSAPPKHQQFLARVRVEINTSSILRTEDGLIEKLSSREQEVLVLLAEGLTNAELSKQLFVSLSTIKTHLLHIFTKLNVKNRTSAIERARQLGLL